MVHFHFTRIVLNFKYIYLYIHIYVHIYIYIFILKYTLSIHILLTEPKSRSCIPVEKLSTQSLLQLKSIHVR